MDSEFYGYGIVANDKQFGNNDIDVFMLDKLSGHNGPVYKKTTKVSHDVDPSGGLVPTNVTKGATVKCKWRNGGANRETAPDVVSNELVRIYKYTDEDRYEWEATGYGGIARKKESVVYLFSNRKESTDKKPPSKNEVYALTVSPRDSKVKLELDGSRHPFNLIIDADKGTLVMSGSKSNLTYDFNSGSLSGKFPGGVKFDTPTFEVTGKIIDTKGNLTTHTHNGVSGSTPLPRN